MDKAGAYGIQGVGGSLVTVMSTTTVPLLGFPLRPATLPSALPISSRTAVTVQGGARGCLGLCDGNS